MTYPPSDPNAYGQEGYPPPQQGYSQPGYPPQAGYDQQQAYAQQQYGQGGYPAVNPNAKSKIAAGLLGIFLGAFGVHNFYLGRTGIAVVQLLLTLLSLFFLSWVSAIWGLVEGILILVAKPGTQWAYDAHGVPLTS
jgi:TM2 domain-containing membrane protein YozV